MMITTFTLSHSKMISDERPEFAEDSGSFQAQRSPIVELCVHQLPNFSGNGKSVTKRSARQRFPAISKARSDSS